MKRAQEISADVVIVGGGPSGLSTALHLVRLNPAWAKRIFVLEKETHPRDKLCGGGITGFGLNQLQSLGLPLEFPFVPVEKAELRYRNRVVTIRGQPAFIVTQRSEFDAWLADVVRARGIRLVENSPVVELSRTGNGIQVRTPDKIYLTQAIVGADGARGIVRRWLGVRERPPRVARVLEAFVPATGFEEEFTRRIARFEFSALRSHLQGYFWCFPSLRDGAPCLNVGIYDSRVDGTAPRAELRELMHEGLHKQQLSLRNIKPEGHPIRWFSPWNRMSDEGILLVGDAAGVDALFGEGISVSLAYGQVAAKTLDRAFKREKLDFKTYKINVLSSPVGRYLLLRWLAVSILSRLSKSDLLTRAVWSLARLITPLFSSSLELPDAYPLNFPNPPSLSESGGEIQEHASQRLFK